MDFERFCLHIDMTELGCEWDPVGYQGHHSDLPSVETDGFRVV